MSLAGGDVLARGGVRAQFGAVNQVSDDKWKAAFDDFDPEKFRRDAHAEKAGNVSTEPGSDTADPPSL